MEPDSPSPVGELPTVPEAPKLTETQVSFIMLMLSHYSLNGELMSEARALEEYGIEPKQYKTWMGLSQIRKALEEGGVVLKHFELSTDKSWVNSALTAEQYACANVMLDLLDTRSDKKKLQDMGVSTAKYAAWLKDPVFQNYIVTRAENLIGDSQHEALLALVDKVRSGDLKAIQYYHEFTGRYVPVDKRANSGAGNLDLQQIIISIVEIIADEVDDPRIADRIGERLKNLMTARTIAGKLINPEDDEPLPMPAIAAKREMTPAMQAFMDNGVGVNG